MAYVFREDNGSSTRNKWGDSRFSQNSAKKGALEYRAIALAIGYLES
jgi:hypothetical protein